MRTRTLIAALALLPLAACSFSASVGATPRIEETKLETKVADLLEQQFGQRPDDVDCPGDLKGEEGEEMRCVLTAGPDQLGMTVTVTSVKDTNVKFDIEVDEEMM